MRAQQGGSSQSVSSSDLEHGARRLSDLARANGLDEDAESIVEVFARTLEPWGDRLIKNSIDAPWRSDVADDDTPYEFSVTYSGEAPELRVLVEAQHREPSLLNNWKAGLKLSRNLEERYEVSSVRHDAVADLFEPQPGARMGIWHAACFRPGRPPDFEVDFDCQAQGRWRAPAPAEEALCRLGFDRAWSAVAQIGVAQIGARGLERDAASPEEPET